MFSWWEKLIGGLFVLFVFTYFGALATYLPYALVIDRECIENGYPNSTITYNFDGYCMTREGSNMVRVDELD